MARWYIIHAYSGFENKVKDAILSEATRLGLDAQVEAVEVPTERSRVLSPLAAAVSVTGTERMMSVGSAE